MTPRLPRVAVTASAGGAFGPASAGDASKNHAGTSKPRFAGELSMGGWLVVNPCDDDPCYGVACKGTN